MFRGVVEHDAMRGIGQKRRTRTHSPENTTLTLVPQVVGNLVMLGDQAHQAFGLMNVQIIGDKMPLRHLRSRGDGTGYMAHKVLFCTCRSHGRRHDCALHDIEIGDQRYSATPAIFELASLRLPRFHEPGVGCLRSSAWMPV